MKHIIFLFSNLLAYSFVVAQQTSPQHIDFFFFKSQQYLRERPDSAIYYAQAALEAASKTGDKSRMGTALNSLGWAEMQEGRYDEAEAHVRESLQLRRSLKNDSLITSSLINLGAILEQKMTPDASLELYREGLALAANRKDTLQLAKLYINMANAWDSNEK